MPTWRAVIESFRSKSSRQLTALLSVNLKGEAAFVERIEEHGGVVSIAHSTRRKGFPDAGAAKAWAENVVDWIEGGMVGLEPVAGISTIDGEQREGGTASAGREADARQGAARLSLYIYKQFSKNLFNLGAEIQRFSRWAFSPTPVFRDAHYILHTLYLEYGNQRLTKAL